MSYAVLVCDDNSTDRAVMATSLSSHPSFEVVEVASQAAARDALEARPFDALVASAVDLLWFVRSAHPATVRFLVSGEKLEGVVKAVNTGAAHRFFQKPCDGDKLCDALEAELRARVPRASGS